MKWEPIIDDQDYQLKHQKEYEIDTNYSLQTDNRLLYCAVRNFVLRQRNPDLDEDNSRIILKKTQTKLIGQFINRIKFQQIPVSNEFQFNFFKSYFQNEDFEIIVSFQPPNTNTYKLFIVFDDRKDRLRQKIQNFRLKQIIVGQFFEEKHQIVAQEVPRLIDTQIQYQKDENILVVYGRASNVEKYAKKYTQAYTRINTQAYQLKSKRLNERLFAYKSGTAELKYKTKIVIEKDKLFIIHKSSAAEVKQELSEISFDNIKPLLKKPELKSFISENRDLVVLKDIKIIGLKNLIDMLKKLAEQLVKIEEKPIIEQKTQFIVLTCHQLNVNESSYETILKQFKSVKFCSQNKYSLQIHNMRISNFVNTSQFYVVVFVNFQQLIQLQAFLPMEDSLNLIEIAIEKFKEDFIHKVQKFKIEQDNCQIIFYRREQFADWNKIVNIINESQTISRIVILKKKWLEEFYSYKDKLNNFVNVVLDQYLWQGSDFKIDFIEQIGNYTVKNQRNVNKLISFVQTILNTHIQNYSYGQYRLDPITCFNIEKMKIENIRDIDIVLCSRKQKKLRQFVYLTFYQKLYQINYTSKKVQLTQVKSVVQYFQKKQINKFAKKMILSGFSFFYLCEKKDMLETVDNSLFFATQYMTDQLKLLYIKSKLEDDHRFKFQIISKPDSITFIKKFISKQIVNLEDQSIHIKLGNINIAYGNFFKKRQSDDVVSFGGDHDVVIDVVDQLLLQYQKKRQNKNE